MDPAALLQLFQSNDNFNIPEEIVFVDSSNTITQAVDTHAELVPTTQVETTLNPVEETLHEEEEREVCPLTELCTIQVVTIAIKETGPEVSQVTIPDALASSLRFNCKVCEKSFQSFFEFESHSKSHSTQQEQPSSPKQISPPDEDFNEDSVDQCGEEFPDDSSDAVLSEGSQMEAIAHGLIGLASSPQKKLTDDIASFTDAETGGREITATHMPSAQVTCYQEVACSVCEMTFTEDSLWEDHIRTVHGVVKPYQCVICGKETENMATLRGHFIKIHGKYSQMVCERKWNKRKKNTSGSFSLPCSLCQGSGKSNQKVLKTSEAIIPIDDVNRVWSGRAKNFPKRNVPCKVCGKILSNRYINKHMKIHTDAKAHKCLVCHKVFREIAELKDHHSVHTGERPYKCRVCERAFRHRTTLYRHMKIHNQVKNFSCTICNRAFSRRDGLVKHMATHVQGNNNFKCSECGEAFRQKQNLLHHYKHSHGFSVKVTPSETI